MSTRHRGAASEKRALDAYIKLLRASESVVQSVRTKLKSESLTLAQLGVLESVWHLGPMCQRELAAKLLVSRANVTGLIDTLEKRGWVQRRAEANDARKWRIHLTPAGRRKIESAFPLHAESIRDRMEALTPEELEALGTLCRKLGKGENGRAPG